MGVRLLVAIVATKHKQHGLKQNVVITRGKSVPSKLRERYNITLDEYDRMLETQGGTCAICHQAPNGRRLDVDHDHTTGKVRGLLCIYCNRAIGLLHDDPELCKTASKYLKEHQQ